MKIISICLLVLGLTTIFVVGQFFWRVQIGKNLAKHSQVFSFTSTNPTIKILVVGDSTAVGTGAESPNLSTAGYFHQDFPTAEIINTSKNGAKVTDIIKMLNQVTGRFDLVLIQGGANNIIYFTPLATAEAEMTDLLKAAKIHSDNVVLLTSGNIGMAPIWPWPLSIFYTQRSRTFLAAFENIAKANGALFVKLFQERQDDVFIRDVKKYYAADGLHLTGAGYKAWYDQIRQTMNTGGITLPSTR